MVRKALCLHPMLILDQSRLWPSTEEQRIKRCSCWIPIPQDWPVALLMQYSQESHIDILCSLPTTNFLGLAVSFRERITRHLWSMFMPSFLEGRLVVHLFDGCTNCANHKHRSGLGLLSFSVCCGEVDGVEMLILHIFICIYIYIYTYIYILYHIWYVYLLNEMIP